MKMLKEIFNSSYAVAFVLRANRDDYLVKGFKVAQP